MTFWLKWIPTLDEIFSEALHLAPEMSGGRPDLVASKAVISQQAGQAAILTASVEHPGAGLLNDPARRYVILGWDAGPDAEDKRLLFRGRLVGFPDSLTARRVELEFHASPEDLEYQLAAFHEAAKSDPARWDDLFVAPEDRGDHRTGLAARASFYDVARTDHAISFAPMIAGDTPSHDNPPIDLGSLDVRLGTRPPREITVRLTAEWEQAASGNTNLTGVMKQAFGGTIYNHATEEEMFAEWPAIGPLGDSGWTIVKSKLSSAGRDENLPRGRVLEFAGREWFTKHPFRFVTPSDGLIAQYSYRQSRREVCEITVSPGIQSIFGSRAPPQELSIELHPRPRAGVDAWAPGQDITAGDLRSRGAFIYQALLDHTSGDEFRILPPELSYDPDNPEVAALDPQWVRVTSAGFALGDTVRDRFFDTDRGLQVIDHGIARGLSKLAELSACITVSASGSIADLWSLTCQDSIRLTGTALSPYDTLIGQVRSYQITLDGMNPSASGVAFTLACVPGSGVSQPEPDALADDYAVDDYFDDGFETGSVADIATGQQASTDGPAYGFDDTTEAPLVPVNAAALGQPGYAVLEARAEHTGEQQNFEAELYTSHKVQAFSLSGGQFAVVADYVNHRPAKPLIYLRLRQLTGHPRLDRAVKVTVDPWELPKQIDLEVSA
ncbi:MAG: hypothetical protein Alpg2KO_00790 [Alphaproteobacteria bacterium]